MLCQLRKMVEIVMDTHSTPFIQPASGAPPPPVHASPYPPVDSPFNIHPACPSVSYPLQPPRMESTDLVSLLSKFSKLVLSLQEVLQLALVRQLKADESNFEPMDAAKASAREYRKSILSQKMRLTSVGITRYDQLP